MSFRRLISLSVGYEGLDTCKLQVCFEDESKCGMEQIHVQSEPRDGCDGDEDSNLESINFYAANNGKPVKIVWFQEGKNHCYDISQAVKKKKITCRAVMQDFDKTMFEIKEIDDL